MAFDFLTLTLSYIFFAIVSFGCFWFGKPLLQRLLPPSILCAVGTVCTKIGSVFLICIPAPVKRGGVIIFKYLFYQRNHVWQGIYVVGVLIVYITSILDGAVFLQLVEQDNLLKVPFICLFINNGFFMLCCLSDAGEINRTSHKIFENVYDFDEVLYKSKSTCITCKHSKPARSKHCGIYDKCIYKFDHYCLWTANAVGGLNHRWFVGFLTSFSIMCIVGIWWITRALQAIISVYGLWKLKYAGPDGTPLDMDFPTLFQTLFMKFPRLVYIYAMSVLTFLLVLGYALYHIYLVCTNQTTNERYKISECKMHYGKVSKGNPYSNGIINNILDDIFPYRVISRRRKST